MSHTFGAGHRGQDGHTGVRSLEISAVPGGDQYESPWVERSSTERNPRWQEGFRSNPGRVEPASVAFTLPFLFDPFRVGPLGEICPAVLRRGPPPRAIHIGPLRGLTLRHTLCVQRPDLGGRAGGDLQQNSLWPICMEVKDVFRDK